MITCYVLRVVHAQSGRLAGTLQLVDDGSTVAFRSGDELLAALAPLTPDEPRPVRVVRVGASARD